jgi:hypothetical protein
MCVNIFMQKYSYLACTRTDYDKLLNFFQLKIGVANYYCLLFGKIIWKVWCFLAEVMILRVSLSKTKVSKLSGFWVSRKIKTWIYRVSWLNLHLFVSPELIPQKMATRTISNCPQGHSGYQVLPWDY